MVVIMYPVAMGVIMYPVAMVVIMYHVAMLVMMYPVAMLVIVWSGSQQNRYNRLAPQLHAGFVHCTCIAVRTGTIRIICAQNVEDVSDISRIWFGLVQLALHVWNCRWAFVH
jgi:hypothetical protein